MFNLTKEIRMKISKAYRCPQCKTNTIKYENSRVWLFANLILCVPCARKQIKFIKITGIQ